MAGGPSQVSAHWNGVDVICSRLKLKSESKCLLRRVHEHIPPAGPHYSSHSILVAPREAILIFIPPTHSGKLCKTRSLCSKSDTASSGGAPLAQVGFPSFVYSSKGSKPTPRSMLR